MTPTLSVIVPVYNTEKYLPACIESVLAQTYTDLELILVDGDSPDNCGRICDEYAAKDSRIKVIHKNGEGQLSSRREGLKISVAPYVTFVDSDDVIEPVMYETLMNELLKNGADIITSGFKIYGDEFLEKYLRNETDFADEGVYEGDALNKLRAGMLCSRTDNRDLLMHTLCTKIYKKDLILKYIEKLPGDLRSWEDLCYSLPPFADAKKVQVTHECFYLYRRNPHSTTKSIPPEEAFSRSLRSFTEAEKNYLLLPKDCTYAFYRKAALIFYSDLWKDYGIPLNDESLRLAAKSAFFKRAVTEPSREERLNSFRQRFFLEKIAHGNIAVAKLFCKGSRLLTHLHVRLADI